MNYRLILVFLVSTTLSFCAEPSSNPNSPHSLTLPGPSEPEELFLKFSPVENTDVLDFTPVNDNNEWAFNTSEQEGLPVLNLPIGYASSTTGASAQKRALPSPSPSDDDSDSDSDEHTTTSAFSPYSGQGSPTAFRSNVNNKTSRTVQEHYRHRQCPACYVLFVNKRSLDKHINRYPYNNCPRHICPICKTLFGNGGTLANHRKTYPNQNCDEVLQCEVCKKVFPNPSSLKAHTKHCKKDLPKISAEARSNSGTLIECNVCHENFKNQKSLEKHKSSFPAENCITPTKCLICNKVCKSRSALTAHKRYFFNRSCNKSGGKVLKRPSLMKEHEQQQPKDNQVTYSNSLESDPSDFMPEDFSTQLRSLEQINADPDQKSIDDLWKELQGPSLPPVTTPHTNQNDFADNNTVTDFFD